MHLLAIEKIFALRINTSSQVLTDDKGHRRFLRSHSGGAGVADIVAFVPTKQRDLVRPGWEVLWIEVKSPTGKQSAEQRSFQTKVESEGHGYLVARSLEDVIKWLREHR